jgi:hypothetical protein
MFGSLRPPRGSLPQPARSVYAAAYRETCQYLGLVSPLARIALYHDVVLMLSLVAPDRFVPHGVACVPCFHRPRRKDPLGMYSAAVSLLMAEIRLADAARDTHLHRYGVAAWWLAGAFRRARTELRNLGFDVRRVHELVERSLKIEQDPRHCTLDEVLYPTAQAYRLVYEQAARLAHADPWLFGRIGQEIGTVTYLHDARRDIDEDRRLHLFNPFLSPTLHTTAGTALRRSIQELRELATTLTHPALLTAALIPVDAGPNPSRMCAIEHPARATGLARLLPHPGKSVRLNAWCLCPCGGGRGGVACNDEDCGDLSVALCLGAVCISCCCERGC